VGGTRQRHFAGTNFKLRKVLENAQTPSSRVHAVLGRHGDSKTRELKRHIAISLIQLYSFNLWQLLK